ncbi:hypothetical protein CYMTET_48745 [Cymbomonas tetramitiformis]|uniref:Uncharacterized protein n=1 Tax=Cymbomonas tetramitiformis TaxID=36881 RepID=A0AAE0EWI0_9CHLO|nr:hypothetical protein CYMTET_48745 [Cymbomonas tetramitiformis]
MSEVAECLFVAEYKKMGTSDSDYCPKHYGNCLKFPIFPIFPIFPTIPKSPQFPKQQSIAKEIYCDPTSRDEDEFRTVDRQG